MAAAGEQNPQGAIDFAVLQARYFHNQDISTRYQQLDVEILWLEHMKLGLFRRIQDHPDSQPVLQNMIDEANRLILLREVQLIQFRTTARNGEQLLAPDSAPI